MQYVLTLSLLFNFPLVTASEAVFLSLPLSTDLRCICGVNVDLKICLLLTFFSSTFFLFQNVTVRLHSSIIIYTGGDVFTG